MSGPSGPPPAPPVRSAQGPKPKNQALPARFELKLALTAAAVASTLGGWAALARSAPASASTSTNVAPASAAIDAVLSGLPPIPTVGAVPPLRDIPSRQTAGSAVAAQAAQPVQFAPASQPAPPAPAPRVVAVPTPRPATGIVAATTRSSR